MQKLFNLNLRIACTILFIIASSLSLYAQDTDNDGILNAEKKVLRYNFVQLSPDIADETSPVYGVWNSGWASAAPNVHNQWVFIS